MKYPVIFLLIAAVLVSPVRVIGQDFSFIVYSDVYRSNDLHQVFIDSMNVMNARSSLSFAICVGDMMGLSNGTPARYIDYMRFYQDIGKLEFPFYPVMGNHEGNGSDQTLGTYRLVFGSIKEEPAYNSGSVEYFSFDYNNNHFISLDVVHSSPLAAQQAWLIQDLASPAAQQAENIFVFMHYTVSGPGGQPTSRWNTFIAPYFTSLSQPVTVFQGDVHYFWKGMCRGMDIVTAPPITAPRSVPSLSSGEIGGSFRGFIKVDASRENIRSTVYDLDCRVTHTFSLIKGKAGIGKKEGIGKATPSLIVSPNPFNPVLIVTFPLINTDKAKFSIFTLDGRRILSKRLTFLQKQFLWKPVNQPAGLYVARLKLKDRVLSKKVMLTR
jgi:hypothetical protein